MNPQTPDIEPYKLTTLDYAVDFFHSVPAAWILIGAVAVLGLAIWLTRRWLPYLRIIEGLKSAPLVTTDSTVTGLVKLVGQAQPGGDDSAGYFNKASYVWSVSETLDTRSKGAFRKTGSYSVAPMLICDSAGDCVVDPQEAVVVPAVTTSKVDRHIFSGDTYHTKKLIRPGDPVIALGQIRSGRLRKSDNGVLLYSGKSEQRTRLRFRFYFWSTFGAMSLCLILIVFGFWAHLQGYPNQAVGEYVNALMSRPFMNYPGVEH